MNVLIVGHGGREHTLVWKIRQSPLVDKVYCAPGNPGMKDVISVPCETNEELAAFAERNSIDFTVVGPEAPLCAGITDVFRAYGLKILGPNTTGAKLEGSKVYAKRFMQRHGIPTAIHRSFTSAENAVNYIREQGAPIVVKANGLAAGKGVTVAQTEDEAIQAVQECFAGAFGEAGTHVVVEEYLEGAEASIVALSDGKTILPLASSQDYKRIHEGDTGPNTGGMGAISPAPMVTDKAWQNIQHTILQPFLDGCRKDGIDYRGVIYAGIIMHRDHAKVLEFNVRFGDPETQAVLPRLQDDIMPALMATEQQTLSEVTLSWDKRVSLCVVLASKGYPGKYETGYPVSGLDKAEKRGALVFHAGTRENEEGRIETAGGRVMSVTALGENFSKARTAVYQAVQCITWPGMYCRQDIGAIE